jgi:putative transposase
MNEKDPQEIAYRRQAFRLFDKEKSVAEILAVIPRSRAWLFKWKQRFEQDAWPALDSRSTAPLSSPQQHSAAAVKLVLRLRRRLEQSKVGLVGPFEIQQEIRRKRLLKSVPSLASIKRWLKDAGMVGAEPEPAESAYYPAIQCPQEFVILSCDWLARYLRGGEKVFVFHTINLYTHALSQTICPDKTAESAYAHWLQSFSRVGLPDFLQIDNDAAFTGLGRTKPVFGRLIRLALYLGIEVIFIPPGEPKRNSTVERVNGLWARSFWGRNHFTSRSDLLRKSKKFPAWYETYAPPSLKGMTIRQAAGLQKAPRLLRRQIAQIPQELPLTAGRVHFIRRVDGQGEISVLKERWKVSKSLAGHYVWATIDLGTAELLIYHRRSLRGQARLIKQYVYELDEEVQSLSQEYRRRGRKVDILKII